MPTTTAAAAYPHIARYRAELDRIVAFGGSANEQSIRRAFENCLADYCAEHKEKWGLYYRFSNSSTDSPARRRMSLIVPRCTSL